jgi:hypothetical protein
MATQEQVQKIRALTDKLTEKPIDSLVSNADWGKINFETARTDFEMIFTLCKNLKELPLDILPTSVAASFLKALEDMNSPIQEIIKFSIESGNPPSVRDQIVARTHQYAEALLTALQGWISFLAYQKGDILKNIEALSKAVNDANSIRDQAKLEAEASNKEIATIVTAAREASASAGVGVFTADFTGQATMLEGEGKKWLQVTAFLAIATILTVIIFSFFIPLGNDASNPQIWQYMTSKILILIVLLTATVWCGRLYKATKHQEAINKHRANALKTFQAFIKAASDDPTRNAVLLETTRSIFAIGPSGYLETTDSGNDSGTTKILEIIKGAASGGR